jgi:kynurenine formamidase
MQRWLTGLSAGLIGGLLLASAGALAQQAKVNDAALDDGWWTARKEFGADDKMGAIQRIGPADVKRAAALIKQGKSAVLGKLYASDIPMVGFRSWSLWIPGTPTGGPFGSEGTIFHDELVTTEIGQVGTQFDGPGHIGVHTSQGDFMYGKRNRESVYRRNAIGNVLGMGDLGVEQVGARAFVCRGVLLDATKLRKTNPLPIPDGPNSPGIIRAQDIEAMVQAQGLQPIGQNDCVFLYTGHGDLWKSRDWPNLSADQKRERAAQFGKGEPGFGKSACEYLADRKIVLLGADTFAVEALPGENAGEGNPCHVHMQPRNGIWFLENLEFTQLLADGVSEFMFSWAPLQAVGATGSPGNPVAIY